MLNAETVIGLGTVVGDDGLILTKASQLPNNPTCHLPDGSLVSARVVGIHSAFDLALLEIPVKNLPPMRWASNCDPPVGTMLAAVGLDERPLAVGIVSVARRNLSSENQPKRKLPLHVAAGRPEIYGGMRPKSGYSIQAALGARRAEVYLVGNVGGIAWSAGLRPGDQLHKMNGRRVCSDEDLLDLVSGRRSGDVIPVRLTRDGRRIDLLLPLAPETVHGEHSHVRDGFPTVIECAVPFYSYECGGPIVDLSGRAVGITIARAGKHGGMIIPGDCVMELLPGLSGKD